MSSIENILPPRSRQRWFASVEYGHGLKIELPFASESDAIQAGIEHIESDKPGIPKVGYYGFRSRVIVYGDFELRELADKCR